MFALLIDFPNIDPVIFKLGPLAVRWYGVAYISGILLAWYYANRLIVTPGLWTAKTGKAPLTKAGVEDMIFWCTIGIIAGGRLGFVLFYAFPYETEAYLAQPWRIFAIWEGGMSFHGGLLGVCLATYLFARKNNIDLLRLGDFVTGVVPFGLGFGRLANFINGELYGRPTDVPWAMIFPQARDNTPRHPSQLYEAFLEGLVLFLLIRLLMTHTKALERKGQLVGVFLAFYGGASILVEFFRDSEHRFFGPDHWLTMGMALSSVMILVGGFLIYRSLTSQPPQNAKTKPK
jgi:phosphatidylglycerol:prolipoprotein diacylglycerol transferase